MAGFIQAENERKADVSLSLGYLSVIRERSEVKIARFGRTMDIYMYDAKPLSGSQTPSPPRHGWMEKVSTTPSVIVKFHDVDFLRSGSHGTSFLAAVQ